jgi:hypothetical protein
MPRADAHPENVAMPGIRRFNPILRVRAASLAGGAGLAYSRFLVAGAQHLPLLAPLEFVAHRFQLLGLEIVARTAEAGVFLLVDVMVDEVFEHPKLGGPGIVGLG